MRKYPDYKYKPRRKPKNISYTPSAGSFHSFNPFSGSLLGNGTAALAAQSGLLLPNDTFNAANYSSVLNGTSNPLNPISQPAVAAAFASINSSNSNLVNKSHFLLNDYYEQLQQQMQRQQTDFPANVDYNSLLKSYPMFAQAPIAQQQAAQQAVQQQAVHQLNNIQMLCANTPVVTSSVTPTVTPTGNSSQSNQINARIGGQQANLADPVSLFYSMQQQFAGNLLSLANSSQLTSQLTNLTNKFTIDHLTADQRIESKEQLKSQTELDPSKTEAKEERRTKSVGSKDGEETECEEDQEIENYENKSLNWKSFFTEKKLNTQSVLNSNSIC